MGTARIGTQITVITALFISSALVGCGGGGGSSSNGDSVLVGPDPTTLSLSGSTPEGLAITLAQEKATVTTTSTVKYTYTVTNASAAPVTIQTSLQTGGTTPLVPASISIQDSTGASVYVVPAPAQATSVTLQPNDFLSQTVTLTNVLQKVGRYQATAAFQTGAVPTSLGPLTVTVR